MPTETKVSLGKLPPRFDARTLRLGTYFTQQLPSPPQSVDYSAAVPNWPVMLNDKLPDCVPAAAGHMIQAWTANAGNMTILTDQQIEDAYKYFSPSEKSGVVVLDFLNYWRVYGVAGDNIAAFAKLELQNQGQVQNTVFLFGSCCIGVALPNYVIKVPDRIAAPWELPDPGAVSVQDAAPNQHNGHCVVAVAYDSMYIYTVSWGRVKKMSWPFYMQYCDEAYAVLSNDWISKTLGTSPSGLDFATLQQDLTSITNSFSLLGNTLNWPDRSHLKSS